jgi:hypothetical protein
MISPANRAPADDAEDEEDDDGEAAVPQQAERRVEDPGDVGGNVGRSWTGGLRRAGTGNKDGPTDGWPSGLRHRS